MRQVQHDSRRRLVERSRPRAICAHLDPIETPNAVLTRNGRKAVDQFGEGHRHATVARRRTALEQNIDERRLIRRVFKTLRQLEG